MLAFPVSPFERSKTALLNFSFVLCVFLRRVLLMACQSRLRSFEIHLHLLKLLLQFFLRKAKLEGLHLHSSTIFFYGSKKRKLIFQFVDLLRAPSSFGLQLLDAASSRMEGFVL